MSQTINVDFQPKFKGEATVFTQDRYNGKIQEYHICSYHIRNFRHDLFGGFITVDYEYDLMEYGNDNSEIHTYAEEEVFATKFEAFLHFNGKDTLPFEINDNCVDYFHYNSDTETVTLFDYNNTVLCELSVKDTDFKYEYPNRQWNWLVNYCKENN